MTAVESRSIAGFRRLRQNWFLSGLLLVIPVGIGLGFSEFSSGILTVFQRIPGWLLTAVILFLMSLTLDSGKLIAALRSPRAVLAASVINQALIPLMALPLLPLVTSSELRLGLLIVSIVPCTMAAASVWTRMANGNDAVSLLVTLLTNTFCFLVIPAWLSIAMSGPQLAQMSESLAFVPMASRLVISAVLPILAGQLLRAFSGIRQQIDRHKTVYSNFAQAILLLIVFMSAVSGGIQISHDDSVPGAAVFVVVLAMCNGLHIAAMLLCVLAGRLLNIRGEDRVAMIFAGSQKTLPIGVAVAHASGVPLAIVPVLMFHVSQLFVDTWVAARIRLENP